MSFRVFNKPIADFLFSHGCKPKHIKANGAGITVKFEDCNGRGEILNNYQKQKRRKYIKNGRKTIRIDRKTI